MKRVVLIFALLIILCTGAAALFVPWNSLLEQRLIAFLNSKGVQDVAFTVSAVGLHSAKLDNITIGKENPLLLQSITVQYTPRELIDGTLQDLTINGLDINIIQTDDKWIVTGLEGFQRAEPKPDTPQLTLSDIVDKLPFSTVRVEDSYIRVKGTSIQTALPFTLLLTKGTEPAIDMTINASTVDAGKSSLSLGIITARMLPNDQRNWNGTWALQSLDPGDSLPFPVASGNGTIAYVGNAITVDGNLSSADKIYTASFKGLYDIAATDKRSLTVTSATFPFKEGVVSSKNILIPLGERKDITINLTIQKVSIDALLQTLTGQRVSATGTVSGSVPVIIKPDGTYNLGQGTLTADSEGTIQMSADAIPGDNEQITLVRDILENLNYSLLSAAVDTTGGQGIIVRLSLEGSNPDVYDGRAVKLNLNLTGDVLDFIQQNAMLITNPEKLLRQGTE
jgi:hypothetical protein